MGVKRVGKIGIVALALSVAWLYLPRATRQVEAQFAGYFAEQTVTYSFSVSGNNPPPTTYALPNIGQAGHSLVVFGTTSVGSCPVWLQASADNSHWFPLVSTGSLGNMNHMGVVFAQGYYPYLQIIVNPHSSPCLGGFAGQYTGYQFPPSNNTVRYNTSVSVSTPTAVDNFAAEIFPNLQKLTAINCYNPGATPAFLQISDTLTPALGSVIAFQATIPATGNFSSVVNVFSGVELQAGASTTWSGTTAVSTPLNCNFEFNPYGPFY